MTITDTRMENRATTLQGEDHTVTHTLCMYVPYAHTYIHYDIHTQTHTIYSICHYSCQQCYDPHNPQCSEVGSLTLSLRLGSHLHSSKRTAIICMLPSLTA